MTTNDGYLTMARIMAKELKKYQRKTLPPTATGWQIIQSKEAFQAGFMAGFQARFFNNEENK